MLIEDARVVKQKKNIAFIELTRNEKCAGCKACGMGRRERVVVPTVCEVHCDVGDRVRVQMPETSIKAAAWVLYAIPLMLLFAGLLCGLPLGEGFMFLFGALFLFVGFLSAFGIDKAYRRQKKFLPRILEKIETV